MVRPHIGDFHDAVPPSFLVTSFLVSGSAECSWECRGVASRYSRTILMRGQQCRSSAAENASASSRSLRTRATMNPAQRALWYIESHLAEPMTLDEIAAISGV